MGRRPAVTGGTVPLRLLAALLVVYLVAPIAFFAARLTAVPAGQLWTSDLGAALLVSLETATVSTLVIAALGIPLAYLLSRARGRLAPARGFAVQLPLALPPLASGILLLFLVGPYAPLGQLLGGRLTDTRVGIVLAQVFVAAPFGVIASRSAFVALDPALADVAATLGHGPWSRFARVALPAAAPGIGAGLLLSWLRAFGEYGATVLLAYHPYSLPVFIYVQFSGTGLPATLGPVVFALVAALGVLALAHAAPRWRTPHPLPSPLPAPRAPAARPGPCLAFDLDACAGDFRLRIAHRPRARHLAVLGPSGAGKTFTLRLLAGLARPRRGRIVLGGEDVTALPPERRRVGYVPQDASLLPYLPVWHQVTFGVDAEAAVAVHWLHRLHLAGLEARRPAQLSGGQRRRVALARALTSGSGLLLLDEPFTGLDAPVRDELRHELRALQRQSLLTTVLVTHDPTEAAILADEVLVLHEGRLLQAGPFEEVLARPASALVARLLGLRNVCRGRVLDGRHIRVGALQLATPRLELPIGSEVTWCVRPDQVVLAPEGAFEARILDRIELGGHAELHAALPGGPAIVLHVASGRGPGAGARCRVDLPASAIMVWPQQPGAEPPPP
jgi:ABC-type sulfate/molybdate transport systems ATPase subunit/ABC-type sulfate transport system permease component